MLDQQQLQAYRDAAAEAKRCSDASEFTCQFDEQMRKQHIPTLATAVDELCAEVERLQGEYARGRADERRDIVAIIDRRFWNSGSDIKDAIELGEHLEATP